MKPAGTQHGTVCASAVPACPHCAALERELQEAREQLAVLQSDVEVAERSTQDAVRVLESSREQYAELYDFAPNAYIILDRQGVIRDANLTAAGLLAEDRLKLRDTLFMRYVAPDSRNAYFRHLSHCRRSHYPTQIATELSLVCADGPHRVQMLSVPDHKADPATRQLCYRTALVDLSLIRLSEQALSESEARYKLLFEQNPSPMYIFDESTLDFIDVNETALRLYGYSREAFLAMSVKDIRPPEEGPAAVAAIRAHGRLLRRGRPGDGKQVPRSGGERRHTNRDGTVFDVEIIASSIPYAGRQARLVLIADITARKQAEAALRDSEARYRTIFEQMTDAVVVFEPQTLSFIDFNETACRRLGYSRKEFARLKLSDFEVIESADDIRRHAQQVTKERVEIFETQHRARNGAVLDIEVRTKAIYHGDRKLIHCIWRDITASKQVEHALRDSEARYRAIFEQAADGILVIDAATLSFMDFNDECCRSLGYSRRQFSRLKLSEVEASESPAEIKRRMRTFSTERIVSFETKLFARSGATVDMEVRAKVVYRGDRKLIHCIWRDITERKRAEAELRRRVEIEHMLAATSNRLGNVTSANEDAVINEVLADIGGQLGADRCYLFRVTEDLAVANNSHEWCRAGIRAQRADLKNIPTAQFPWLLAQLRHGAALGIQRLADIPREAAAERQLLARRRAQSALLVPIRHGRKLTGFIGCDAVRSERAWNDSDTRLLRIVGEIVTEAQLRSRSDAAVRSAAQEWSATFDGVSDAVWVLDLDQHILRCNKAAAALFGKSQTDMVGRPCWEIAHGTRQPIPGCPFTRARQSSNRETMELALNGRWYQVVVDPLLDAAGKLTGAVHIVSDITERKQNEEALRNNAAELERRVTERTAEVQRLAAVVQRSGELIGLATPDQRCVFINDAGARLLGIAATDIGSYKISDFLTAEERPRLQQEILPAIRKRHIWQGEIRYRNLATGADVQVAAAIFSIPDPATGQIQYLATTSIDISDRKALEQQVLEISEREQRRIGLDLHDSVGQQLAAVKFMSGTLSKRLAQEQPTGALAAAQIEHELQRAMEEVRAIARGLHPIRPDGDSFMSALYELAASVTRLFKVPCHFVCSSRVLLHDVQAATHLYRIAQEAVSNATRHARAHHIWIRLRTGARDGVRLSIEDDGRGLQAGGERPQGLGLRIMSYRASIIGATFNLGDRHGGGTRIVCEWKPHKPQQKAAHHAL